MKTSNASVILTVNFRSAPYPRKASLTILDNSAKAGTVSVGNCYIDPTPLQRISVYPKDILAQSTDLRPPHQHLERTLPTQKAQILP